MTKYFAAFIIFLLSFQANAQHAVSIKPIVYGYHPYADPNNEIAPKKQGSAGTFAIEPGLLVGYENYITNSFFGIKGNLACYVDNANKVAGMVHIGFRVRTFSGRQAFALSVGPSYFVRDSWANVPGYTQDDDLINKGAYEHAFAWLSGEVEYIFAINEQHRLSFAFTQLNPKTFTFTLGYAFWMDKLKKGRVRYRKKSRYYRRR